MEPFVHGWYVGTNGNGTCPVVVVGEVPEGWVVWKLICGIVIERVVRKDKVHVTSN